MTSDNQDVQGQQRFADLVRQALILTASGRGYAVGGKLPYAPVAT